MSAAEMLHFKPDMLTSISQGICGMYPKRPKGHDMSQMVSFAHSLPEFFSCNVIPANVRAHPMVSEIWESLIWGVVVFAGVYYLCHGFTGCRLNADFVFLFGLLKLQTAATIGEAEQGARKYSLSEGRLFQGGNASGG